MAIPPFSPLNIPPSSTPDLTQGNRRWYKRWIMWLLVAGVALGAFLFR